MLDDYITRCGGSDIVLYPIDSLDAIVALKDLDLLPRGPEVYVVNVIVNFSDNERTGKHLVLTDLRTSVTFINASIVAEGPSRRVYRVMDVTTRVERVLVLWPTTYTRDFKLFH